MDRRAENRAAPRKTARGFVGVGGRNRGGSARTEAERYYAHRRSRNARKHERCVWSVGYSNDGDPREDGHQIEHCRDEVRRETR